MHKGRLEAFSDGVIAVLITILVLELKAPHGDDWSTVTPLIPAFVSYVLSFVYLGIYWNNHHHLLQAASHVTGAVLWANLHILFWLSLIPFVTVVATSPGTKQVTGSNHVRVFVSLDTRTGRILAIGVEDNLVKGAAGQAVQAFNIVHGLPETAGLEQLPLAP